MKVKYALLAELKRRDGMKGNPTGVTDGKVYDVVDFNPQEGMFTILNDEWKLARYDMRRFIIVDDSPIPSIRSAFNTLTTPLRTRIKELEKQLESLK